MNELLSEAGRGLAGLWNRPLWWAIATAAVVIVALGLGASRRDLRVGGWPLLVVVIVGLSVPGRIVVPVALATGGWWLAARSGLRPPARPALLLVAALITALGLYGTLPETQEAITLLTAVGVVGLAGLAGALDLDRVGVPGVGALAAVLVWVVFAGDGQRLHALLAGGLCLAMLAVVTALLRAPAAPLLLLHAGVTVAASRWVGLAEDVGGALQRALPVVAVAVVGAAVLWRLRAADLPDEG